MGLGEGSEPDFGQAKALYQKAENRRDRIMDLVCYKVMDFIRPRSDEESKSLF